MVDFNPAIPVTQTVEALFGQAQSLPYGDGQRVPFAFGSTLRELQSQLAIARDADQTDAEIEESFRAQGFTLSTDELYEVVNRFATLDAQPFVRTLVNPRSIRWRQPKRIQRKDIRNGTVFFHFTDDNGQDNDVLELELTGSTGNVDLRGDNFPLPATQDVAARAKLAIFQNLYALTREPRLIPPNIVNEFSIVYATKAFPAGITFFGFYSEVLEFEESAEKPNSVDWRMRFTVQRTDPNLNDVIVSTINIIDEGTAPDPSPDSALFEGVSGG